MEFWLSYNNREEVLQLPVPPSEFTIQKGTQVNVVNIHQIGEISVIGKGKLATIEISSFFPKQAYSFCQYSGFPEPYECIKLIEKWVASGKPIRLIITNTNINLAASIEKLSYGERDGSGDVYFSLSLKEYRFIKTAVDGVTASSTSNRPVEKKTAKKYTVQTGDTLWLIAKKMYGDGSKYATLASKNNIMDIGKIQVGQVLVL